MKTTQSPKIGFYKQRPFGDKLNASFDFVKENWKPLLKYMTYLILPFCLIQALSINSIMRMYIDIISAGNIQSLDSTITGASYWFISIVSTLCQILSSLLFFSLIFALVKIYNEREARLNDLTFSILRPVLFRNIGRIFLLGIIMFVVLAFTLIVVSILYAIYPLTLLLTIPLFLAFIIAISLCVPVYLFEDIGILQSIAKGIRLGFATWGGVFAVMFIMGLIGSILTGIMIVPWYLATIVKVVLAFSTDAGASAPPVFYNFFSYVLAVILVFGGYLSLVFSILGLSYQYAHATEKMDSITIEDDIDNFEKL